MAYSPQPPIGKTGAPGESNCASCHTTPNTNYGGFVSLTGLPTEIIGNQTYTLTLNVISTAVRPEVGGFQLAVLDSANNTNAGNLELINFTNTSYQTDSTARQYVGHKNAMAFANSDTIAWTFNWTAPPTPSTVTFYSAALLGNNQGDNTGDTPLIFTESHNVSAPLSMEVVINSVSDPVCYNGANGVAHAAVHNGMQPYTYIWSTGDTIAWVYNLAAGTHTVTVTDANNQVASQSVTIGQPDEIIPAISASSLIIPCGESVTLHGSATGGTGPLTFSWNNGVEDADSIVVTTTGYYCLTATDSAQCQANTCVGVNLDMTGIFCNGISTDTLTCAHPSTVLHPGVTAADTISYSWTGPNGFTSTDTLPQITQGGTYTLVATIPTGCSCTSNINVIELTDFEVQIAQLTPTSCYYSQDGAINVNITSGNYPPFTTVPANFTGDSLSIGSYSVTATNALGCSTSLDFSIDGPDSINVTPSITNIIDNTPGAINIITAGGTPTYSYVWSPLDSATVTINGSLTNITAPGDYSLTVIDSNGCNYSFGPFTVGLVDNVQDITFFNSITISPNPASDYILITQKDRLSTLDVYLYGLNNQLIDTYQFSERKNKINIDQLPEGIYQLILKAGTKIATKQIVIRK